MPDTLFPQCERGTQRCTKEVSRCKRRANQRHGMEDDFFKTSRHPSSHQIHKCARRQAPHDGFMKQCKRTGVTLDAVDASVRSQSDVQEKRSGKTSGALACPKKVDEQAAAAKSVQLAPIELLDKAFEGEPLQVRARTVAREFESGSRLDLYARTSPVEGPQLQQTVGGRSKSCTSTCRTHSSTPKLRGQCWCVCR